MNRYAKTTLLILSFSLPIVTSSISFAQSFSFVALGDHPYKVARHESDIAWIQAAFDEARNKSYIAIVFAYQADVLISRSMWEDFPAWSSFRNSVGETLLPLAREWNKPVLLIHADRQQYHFDQPFKLNNKLIENLTRLQVPGASDVRAVRVQVDPTASSPFSVELITP